MQVVDVQERPIAVGVLHGEESVQLEALPLRTQRPEQAASADAGARTAPRRGRDFRQEHQLEQAARGGPSRRARNGAEARTCRAMPQHSAVERSRIALERTRIAPDEGLAFDFDLVSLGLHCFLWLSAAGLIVVLIPGCCWALPSPCKTHAQVY